MLSGYIFLFRAIFGIESSLTLPGAIARLNEQMGLPPTGTLPDQVAALAVAVGLSLGLGRNGSGRIS